jgi:enoyl-CoA hydratase/carnithine racemase
MLLSDMRLFTYPRPTVAAVNGDAFAGALITAAVCDHRVAVAEDAKFGLNEVPIGIPMPAVYVRMLAYAWGEPAARARAYSAKSSLPQRRPARQRATQRNDQRAGPPRVPPLLAATQRPTATLVNRARTENAPGASPRPDAERWRPGRAYLAE